MYSLTGLTLTTYRTAMYSLTYRTDGSEARSPRGVRNALRQRSTRVWLLMPTYAYG